MNGGPSASIPMPPTECKSENQDKDIKRTIRKQVKDTLLKLLTKSLIEDKRDKAQPGMISLNREESLTNPLSLYGFLVNPVTKKSDLILGARTEYFACGNLVFYTVDDSNLFKTFPAAGIYQGPYKHNKPVFVEVCARIDDMYVCKHASQLRYVELMSQNKEK